MYNFISVNSFEFRFFFLLLFFDIYIYISKKYSKIQKIEIKLNIKTDNNPYLFFEKQQRLLVEFYRHSNVCKHVERSQSKRPRLLAIHGRHDNRCIQDQICNRSINRTSNLEFLYRGRDTIGIDDPPHRSNASLSLPFCSIFSFFLSLVFRFRNAVVFCSILMDIFCARGFIFESELNKFRKGFPKESGQQSICINSSHCIPYKSVYFHGEGKIFHSFATRCNCAIVSLFAKTRSQKTLG